MALDLTSAAHYSGNPRTADYRRYSKLAGARPLARRRPSGSRPLPRHMFPGARSFQNVGLGGGARPFQNVGLGGGGDHIARPPLQDLHFSRFRLGFGSFRRIFSSKIYIFLGFALVSVRFVAFFQICGGLRGVRRVSPRCARHAVHAPCAVHAAQQV